MKDNPYHYFQIYFDQSIFLENMSEDNNNNEQCSTFSEQDKELAFKAKQEYEAGQYDGLY